jgi:Mg2+/Co2+ transporter CorB
LNDIPIGTLYGFLFVLIILSGFFSSSETSLMALNRYRMRHLANNGHRAAQTAQQLLLKPDRLIGLILLGNNLVNILAAAIATIIGIRLFGDNGVWIASLALTVIILIFAEVAPKTVAALHPERIAYPASFILSFLLKIFYPLVWLINIITNLLLKPLGIEDRAKLIERLNLEELRTLLQEGGHVSNDHQRMLVNILDLEQATVEDVMITRQEIVGIDLNEDWNKILIQLTQTLYTRMPVYRESIDQVEGLLHIRSIIAKLSESGLTFEDLKRSISAPYFIPEGTNLMRQLLEFQSRERRMGLVVDEYGDIQGMVTLDDILEEIVGEYTTDGKEQRLRSLRQLDDETCLVDGATSVRMLNRRMGWNLPEEEANTLNGLLLEELEAIPSGNTSVRIGNHLMTIVDIKDNVISKVKIRTEQND